MADLLYPVVMAFLCLHAFLLLPLSTTCGSERARETQISSTQVLSSSGLPTTCGTTSHANTTRTAPAVDTFMVARSCSGITPAFIDAKAAAPHGPSTTPLPPPRPVAAGLLINATRKQQRRWGAISRRLRRWDGSVTKGRDGQQGGDDDDATAGRSCRHAATTNLHINFSGGSGFGFGFSNV
ncbi:hypothetical protein EDB89DRAFT_1916297 [Lactarius sanguifluus]|nr:hypothetical protein EDB89DRAFT_1916297 [Lactarius sanguifluus]